MDLVVDCYEWMGPRVDDGWVHGWTMDGWMDGGKGREGREGQKDGWVDCCNHGWIVVIMDGCMDGWMDGCMDGWLEGSDW